MNKRKFLSVLLSLAVLSSIIGIPVFADNETPDDTGISITQEAEPTAEPEAEITAEPEATVQPEPMAEPETTPETTPEAAPEQTMQVEVTPDENAGLDSYGEAELMVDDTITYPIEKDQTYSFENIGTVSYDITGLSSNIDYVIYYKDGSVSDYNWNQRPGTLSVPSGGKAVITSTNGTVNAVVADEYFLIEEETNPAMVKVSAGIYETYTFTNTSAVSYNILASGSAFDYVIYDADGNVTDYNISGDRTKEVPAGYSIKVTPTSYAITFNGIYENFTVTKNDTPAMKKTVVSVGETYTYTNNSNSAFNLRSNVSTFEYVIYDSDGNITAYDISGEYTKEIPAGYSIKVTPTSRAITFNGIYEKFTVTKNDTPVMKKTAVSVGETYTYTNNSNSAFNLRSNVSSFEYVIYDSDGNITAYDISGEYTKEIPAGYSIKVTPTNYAITFYGIYEKFTVTKNDTPAMKKTVVSVGETYTYTNNSNSAFNLRSNVSTFEYVIYDSDGNITAYDISGEYTKEIPAGYSIKVTPTKYTTTFYVIYEIFNVEKITEPVMKRTAVSVGETYTYTNTGNIPYNLLNTGNSYDYVLYYSDDTVKETASGVYKSSISIPAGGKIKVTPTKYNMTFNGIYEIFDVTANTTLENYLTLSSDKTYIVTNTDTVDNTLQFKTASTSDYAIYSADGALSEYKTRSSSDITIPKGGKAIITPNALTMDSFINDETITVAERTNPVYNTTYINPGETYKYTNTASRELAVFKNGLSCDYIIYNADNSISTYGVNSTSDSFTVPINGSIYITAHDYINIKGLYDYFTVAKADKEVFDTITCTLGNTYTFTNNAVKDINLYLSSGRYDYVIYNADNSVTGGNMNADATSITVPSGSKCVITPLVSNLSVHALETAFTASTRSYPVFKRAEAYFGEKLIMTNVSAENKTLYSATGTYIDYVTYDAGNNPQEAKELSAPSSITVPANGRVEITVRASNITVGGLYEAFSDEDFSVKVTGIALSDNYLSLVNGKQSVLRATVFPDDATNKTITWTSSDSSVAAVAQTGKVTAKAIGTAVITATTADGGFSASCTVNVTDGSSAGTPVTGISLNKTAVSLTVGGTEILTAEVSPENADNKTVMWTSSNSNIASVINGAVTAKSAGTAVITATAADGGFRAECVVTVTGNSEPVDYPYEITSLSIKTESGTALTNAPTGQSFIVNAELIEKNKRDEEDYLFIAVYGADGALLSMNYMKSDFVTNQAYNLGLNIQSQSKPIGNIKAFVWSGFNSMEPLAESKEL